MRKNKSEKTPTKKSKMPKSKSNYDSMELSHTDTDNKDKSSGLLDPNDGSSNENDPHHRTHSVRSAGQLLEVMSSSRQHAASGGDVSTKSSQSINSSYSNYGSFLPTPDVNSHNASNNSSTLNIHDKKQPVSKTSSTSSVGVVALASAAIGASLFLSDKEQKAAFGGSDLLRKPGAEDNEKAKLIEGSPKPKGGSFKEQHAHMSGITRSSFLMSSLRDATNTVFHRLTSSVSLTPVKITVQNENGSSLNSPVESSTTEGASIGCTGRKKSTAGHEKTTRGGSAVVPGSKKETGGMNSGNSDSKRNLSLESHQQKRDHSRVSVRGSFVNELLPANASSTGVVSTTSKPGSEVLSLISIWIRNAPNDFMGNKFNIFNLLDQLKLISFKILEFWMR